MRCALLAVAAACLFAPATADAYRPTGDTWRDRVITYTDRTGSAYGHAAQMAIAAWNTSGMRLVLVPAPRGRADVRIIGRRHGTHGVDCFGVAGATEAPASARNGILFAQVEIATGCGPRSVFRQVTAHELGHALGLAHENRRCATMAASDVIGLRRCGPLWNRPCRLLQADDIRGVVSLYGGRASPVGRTMRAACHDHAPSSPGTLAVGPDPAGTISTARLTVHGAGGHAVIVGRRRGACPSSPVDARGTFFYAPTGTAVVPAVAPQAAAGPWCYRVWRVSAGGHWSRPRTVVVAHGARSQAARIGLTATATAGIPWVRFTEPQAPAGFVVTIEAREGTCAARAGDLRVLSSGSVRTGLHDAVPDTSPPGSGAARCYRVVVHDGSYPTRAPAFVARVTYQAA